MNDLTTNPRTASIQPRRRTTASRSVAAALAAAALLAACGGGDDPAASDVTDTVVAESSTSKTTSDTTAATSSGSTTDPADDTDPTAPPSSPAPVDAVLTFPAGPEWAEWLAVRRVTSDDGYWQWQENLPLPVEVRTYWARCDADACTEPQFDVRLLSDTESTGLPLLEATVEGLSLTWGDSEAVNCLDPSTNEATGPLHTTQTSGWTLERIGDSGGVWQGSYETNFSNDGSVACLAEESGYRASMLLFDPTQVSLADDPAGVWWGENTATTGVERLIRACEPGEGCDAVLRIAVDDPSAATPTRTFHDVLLSRGPDGVLYGSTQYTGSCLSDLDRSRVADIGYDNTHEFWVSVYDLPGTDEGRAAEMVDRLVGTTRADLPAEQAAVCAPFETTDRMIALSNDTSVVIQWTDEAGVAVPLPAA